jgi:hypothetical protein
MDPYVFKNNRSEGTDDVRVVLNLTKTTLHVVAMEHLIKERIAYS